MIYVLVQIRFIILCPHFIKIYELTCLLPFAQQSKLYVLNSGEPELALNIFGHFTALQNFNLHTILIDSMSKNGEYFDINNNGHMYLCDLERLCLRIKKLQYSP